MEQGKSTERSISAGLRILLVALALVIHLLMVGLLSDILEQYFAFAFAAMEAAALVCAIRIYNRRGSPSYKILWILLIMVAPVSGLILYSLLGKTPERRRKEKTKQQPLPEVWESQRISSENNFADLKRSYPNWSRLAAYLQKKDFLLYGNTDAVYFPCGEAFFDDLIERMAQAEKFIFLEYFIVAEGQVWDRIAPVLRERAAAGVEVKLIFDDFGNITRFKGDALAALRSAGVEVRVFNPVHRYVNRLYFNFRDHRKIAVVDGEWAYTGGINIADEYANVVQPHGHWKDTAVRLHGEGAWGVTRRFIRMWVRCGGTMPRELDEYHPTHQVKAEGYCQFVTDGPENNPDNPIEDMYLQLISSAKETFYVTTPYLAVEDYMVNALCCAADGGVDVRLMVPGIPDKKYVYYVTESYFEQLLEHGVRIYLYSPGFLHCKSVMADREVALVGSVNMDYRSFQLHYEAAALFYGSPVVEDLRDDMERIMEVSEEISRDAWKKRGLFRRMAEQFLRLFDAWM